MSCYHTPFEKYEVAKRPTGFWSNLTMRKNGNDWLALDETASPVPMNPNRRAPIGWSAGPRGPESTAFPSEPEDELTVTQLRTPRVSTVSEPEGVRQDAHKS